MNRYFNNISAKNHISFYSGFLAKVGWKLPTFFLLCIFLRISFIETEFKKEEFQC